MHTRLTATFYLAISLLIGLFQLALPSSLQAQQNFYFDYLGTKDGLADETAFEVHQDRQGYIWVGTSVGFQRYDGHEFLSFQQDSSKETIQGELIRCITELADGTIWFGTKGGGVLRYQNGRQLPPLLPDDQDEHSISGNIVEDILEADDGSIWIGTNLGLDLYREGKIVKYKFDPTNPQSVAGNRIYAMEMDTKGRLWVGTSQGLSIMMPDGNFKTLKQ